MKDHAMKMIAPIVITILVILYLLIYFGAIVYVLESVALKLLLAAVPALLGTVMVGVLIQRIKEIKGGEEDDLGQY